MKTELQEIVDELNRVKSGEERQEARLSLIRSLSAVLKDANGRPIKVNKKPVSKDPADWQTVETPYGTAHDMCAHIVGEKVDVYVVWFSLTHVEALIFDYHVSPKKIIFIGDREIENTCARFYGVEWTELLSKEELIWADDMSQALSNRVQQIKEKIDMKFKTVSSTGNPPYQTGLGDGGNGSDAKPLYHIFDETIDKVLKPDHNTLIIPFRWAGNSGKPELEEYGRKMREDRRLKVMKHFPAPCGVKAVFPTVTLPGGVCYFYREKGYEGACTFNGVPRDLNEYDVIVGNATAREILKKVKG